MTRLSFNARLIVGAAAAACVALGGAASAEAQDDGWYMGLTMPLMFIDDSDATSTTTVQGLQQPVSIGAKVTTEHDTGFKFGAMLGYYLDSGIRIEGELFMARADIAQITNTNVTVQDAPLGELRVPLNPSGTAEQLGAMLNIWYDFEMGSDWSPYVGGGLGLIRIDQGDLDYDQGELARMVIDGLPQVPPGLADQLQVPEISTTDTAFAYQFGAGIGYALSESTTLQIGYRLQALNGLEFTGMNQMASVRAETDLRIHFLEIGIRYRF